MLQCIAIDDEPLALSLLEDYISRVPFLKLMATCSDAFEATKILQDYKIDLMFLDIQMPGLTGLQFIQSLRQKPLAILITAYKQYALDSYELDIVDYLVKPVALDRFMKACNKAKETHENKFPNLLHLNTHSAEYFFQSVDYSQIKIMFNDIIWIEGLRDYIKIHLKSSNKPLIIRSTVKSIEEELPQSKFIRIHKSYVVSIESITAIRKNSLFIKDFELPIGESYRESVLRLTAKGNL